MLGVERADARGQPIHRAPQRQRVGDAGLDLVAHAPGEQGRVVAVAGDEVEHGVFLCAHGARVGVVETVARVLQPQPHHHLQAEALRLVEHPGIGLAVHAHDLGAGGGEAGEAGAVALEGGALPSCVRGGSLEGGHAQRHHGDQKS